MSGAHAGPVLTGGLQDTGPFALFCTGKVLQILQKHFDQFPSVHLSRFKGRRFVNEEPLVKKEHLSRKAIDLGPKALTC